MGGYNWLPLSRKLRVAGPVPDGNDAICDSILVLPEV